MISSRNSSYTAVGRTIFSMMLAYKTRKITFSLLNKNITQNLSDIVLVLSFVTKVKYKV